MKKRKYGFLEFILGLGIVGFVIGILGILMLLVNVYQFMHSMNYGYFDLENLSSQNAGVSMPIDRPREAAKFALTQKLLPLDDLDQVEEQIDWPVKWKLQVSKKNSLWQVILMIPRVLPTYACTVQFTELGEPGPNGYVIEPCHWRK